LKRREERDRRESDALQRLLETPGFESDVLDYSIDPFELGDDVEPGNDYQLRGLLLG